MFALGAAFEKVISKSVGEILQFLNFFPLRMILQEQAIWDPAF